MKIDLVDVKAQYAPLIPEFREAFERVVESGRFIFGPEVQAFEEEAAAYLGVPHAIGVANGTDALVLALEAMGVGAGDEVICPSFTFYATAEAIARVGATPVFADIDPVSLNLDPEDVERRIGPRTKAIVPVHLFGRPAPLAELAAFGLPLLEDAAQAFGAEGIATTGVASTFSFFPTKNLFALGDGGLVAATDDEVAERIRMLRFHGSRDKKTFELIGTNSRLDALQAAFLRISLPHLDGWNASRREGAARYAELGLGDAVELPADAPGHVYHMYVVRTPERDRIAAALAEREIASAAYYVTPLHLQPAMRHLGWERGSLPETEKAAAENLALPLWGGIGAEVQERVVSTVLDAVGVASARVRTPINRHRLPQLAADLAIVVAAWFLAFRLRFDTDLPVYYEYYVSWQILGLVAAIKLSIFALFGFYNRWWRYVSTRDMWGAARGVVAASLVTFLVFSFFDVHAAEVPRTVWVIDGLLTLALVAGSRMLARTIIERPQSRSIVARGKEVIVVGAGDAAQLMLKEILRTPDLGYTPIGLVDDDPRKKNMRLHGIRVLGTSDELPHLLRDRRPDELLIAIPSASGEQRARIVEMARAENVPVKTLPGLNELIAGDLDLARQVRPVEVEDLLGREPVEVDLDAIASYVKDKTVLVTGAGGSIGSELCRQLARAEPTRIVMVDQAESSLFEIERELVDERRFSACVPVLADVRDRRRLGEVFERYRPDVVFHAAAYKHVPLMEANPLVSVANNVLGTRNVADVAIANGVERFVLISTDKALNPYSVYGQTKTLCEWIVGSHGERDDVPTKFVAVRFGNVLNSAGSVIPLFRRQIERGGPVTVTDAEMTRFFMTIPEAVALVIQAGAIGGRGRIMVLDMGEPIRIVDLARNMIRLSGKEPDRDVQITFIGARPGEKIHEELFAEGETWKPTTHPKIVALDVSPVERAWLEGKLDELERLVETGDTLELVGRLAAIVSEPNGAPETREAGAATAATPAPESV